MTNIDIDYLVYSAEECCSEVPITRDDAERLSRVLLTCVKDAEATISTYHITDQQSYAIRMNDMISSYQFPSLLFYSHSTEYPYFGSVYTQTDNRLSALGQINSIQDVETTIMVRNTDNTLLDAMVRFSNYMCYLGTDMVSDIVGSQVVDTIERTIIGVSILANRNAACDIAKRIKDEYISTMTTSEQMQDVLEHMENLMGENRTMDSYHLYEDTYPCIEEASLAVYVAWVTSFLNGEPVHKDHVKKMIYGIGENFANIINKYVVLGPDDYRNLVLDFIDVMIAESTAVFLLLFTEAYMSACVNDLLVLVNDNDKLLTFKSLVGIFQLLARTRREII